MWRGRPGEPGWVPGCLSEDCTGSVVRRGKQRQRPTCVTALVRDTKQGTHTGMLQPLKFFKSEDEEKLPRPAALSLDYPLAFP